MPVGGWQPHGRDHGRDHGPTAHCLLSLPSTTGLPSLLQLAGLGDLFNLHRLPLSSLLWWQFALFNLSGARLIVRRILPQWCSSDLSWLLLLLFLFFLILILSALPLPSLSASVSESLPLSLSHLLASFLLGWSYSRTTLCPPLPPSTLRSPRAPKQSLPMIIPSHLWPTT